MSLLATLKFITQHPLTRRARAATLNRWLRWQLGSRLLPGPVVMPYVNDARLIVRPGLTGATGNVYVGLHEFEDMAFVLHALRPDDLFVDIGANVGSYTVLAGAAVGARCISIEPIPEACGWLRKNVTINEIAARVEMLNLGLGRENGRLKFTSGHDTVNHVLSKNEDSADSLEVPIRTLDEVINGEIPVVIKIDVEGWETEVIAGAQRTLANPRLLAVIMELNGSGSRYGFDESALHQHMLAQGFKTYSYHPFERELTSLHGTRSSGSNTLYIRDARQITQRVRSAPRFRLGIGGEI